MRTLIVDDEPWARHALVHALRGLPDLELVGEAANGRDALEQIEELRPDLVFLDIEMPGMSGLEVLAQASFQPLVIFATAYSEYAIQAFEAEAIDYLLKPLQPERLLEAVARARKRFSQADNASLKPFLQRALPLRKVAARKAKRIVLVPREDILFVAVEDGLVFLHTASERLLVERTLAELESLLEGAEFFRVSRATLVNLEAVREMFPWLSAGTWRVKLVNGVELDVSRERARLLKQRVGL